VNTSTATRYVGWIREGRAEWQAVAAGPDLRACHQALSAYLRRLGMVPPASACLPAGVHPGQRDG
jgi:hypothetical protein